MTCERHCYADGRRLACRLCYSIAAVALVLARSLCHSVYSGVFLWGWVLDLEVSDRLYRLVLRDVHLCDCLHYVLARLAEYPRLALVPAFFAPPADALPVRQAVPCYVSVARLCELLDLLP